MIKGPAKWCESQKSCKVVKLHIIKESVGVLSVVQVIQVMISRLIEITLVRRVSSGTSHANFRSGELGQLVRLES